MRDLSTAALAALRETSQPLDVSIVMPCLNEAISLPHCIANAHAALVRIAEDYGLAGEIVIADNGSTDGSQALSQSLGARVVPVAKKGYGAAIIGGCEAAFGRYLLIGDADGSYDFTDGVAMIGALADGAELCMGSRFQGGIAPGAMPWKNRYIGNPALTGVLNLFFRTGVDDAHCGLRAITREAFDGLALSTDGMEFASEMVVKASLAGLRIIQTPATLSPDLRDRAPHLRPWRDGWRHLRYLMMLSPTWLFALPAAAGALTAILILALAALHIAAPATMPGIFGNYWVIAATGLASVSHVAGILALATNLYGIREGYRRAGRKTAALARWVTLEAMLVSGLAAVAAGLAVLLAVAVAWSARNFTPTFYVLPAAAGTLIVQLGVQNVLGGFLLAIVGGHQAAFLDAAPRQR